MSSWWLGRPPWREGAGGKDAIVSAFVPQQTRFSGVVGGPVARSRRSKRQKGAGGPSGHADGSCGRRAFFRAKAPFAGYNAAGFAPERCPLFWKRGHGR